MMVLLPLLVIEFESSSEPSILVFVLVPPESESVSLVSPGCWSTGTR